MNPIANRSAMAARSRRSSFLLSLLLPCAALVAQQQDVKPAPVPDPVKGWHDMSPMTPSEIAARNRRQRVLPPDAPSPAIDAVGAGWQPPRTVLFDRPGDGRLWASTPTYKASFGPEGFVYVPFFGSQAPHDFPVNFVLRNVRVGGQQLPLGVAEPQQADRRVTLDHGAVREVYDLGVDDVEQTFVVDSALAGDVEIDIDAVSELCEDATLAGIQFGNELGRVEYGEVHVLADGQRVAVPTTGDGNRIHIHVPAKARGAGPLVVDPIIHNTPFLSAFLFDCSQPDVAFDRAHNQYLLVWQHEFSATDTDIYCEFHDGTDGTLVANSTAAVDVTTVNCANPRVANVTGLTTVGPFLVPIDVFLVVMQQFQLGHWQIHGRRRVANAPISTPEFAISDPLAFGDHVNPDVGGDPSTTGTPNWLVVWERQASASDYDIHARIVHYDASLPGNTILIENSAATVYSRPSVSQSNGNGFATAARWVVAYQFRFSATDEDIYGAAIAQDGTIVTPNSAIDTSVARDQVPTVSSPNTTSAGGSPLFLVTYERQSPFAARARLLSSGLQNQIPAVDLSAAFGLGGFWVRAECDGTRFAVLNATTTIGVATLAHVGNGLVLNEASQPLTGVTSFGRLCSKRSSGGPPNEYGIAYVDSSTTPHSIRIANYEGRQPGNVFAVRAMGCNGLGIGVTGNAFLGQSVTFDLTNAGFDIPGFVYGNAVPASTAFCASCPLGVDLVGAIIVVGSSLTVAVPPNAALVGYQASVQGFALGSGPCALQLRFSDTIDFTVR